MAIRARLSHTIEGQASSGTPSHSACTPAFTQRSLSIHSAYALRSSAIIGPAEPRYAVGTPLTDARILWGEGRAPW